MSFLEAQTNLHLMILPLHEGSGLFTNQTEGWEYNSACLLTMQEAGFDPQCCIKPDKVTYMCNHGSGGGPVSLKPFLTLYSDFEASSGYMRSILKIIIKLI